MKKIRLAFGVEQLTANKCSLQLEQSKGWTGESKIHRGNATEAAALIASVAAKEGLQVSDFVLCLPYPWYSWVKENLKI
jgi:hypothetical protein